MTFTVIRDVFPVNVFVSLRYMTSLTFDSGRCCPQRSSDGAPFPFDMLHESGTESDFSLTILRLDGVYPCLYS
jgi:hypothetical protein